MSDTQTHKGVQGGGGLVSACTVHTGARTQEVRWGQGGAVRWVFGIIVCETEMSGLTPPPAGGCRQCEKLCVHVSLSSGVLQQRQTVATGDRPLRQRERQQAASRQQV